MLSLLSGNTKQLKTTGSRWCGGGLLLGGDERVLKDLESNWGSVSIQTAWKLELVMEFEATMSPTPQKHHTIIPSDKRSEDLHASANMHSGGFRGGFMGAVAPPFSG